MHTFAAALLYFAAISDPFAARCSIPLPMLSQIAQRDTFVVLEATPDSVPVPFSYRFDSADPFSRTAPPDSLTRRRATVVYGQVFRVRRAEGQDPLLQRRSDVVVIWWTLGISCQRSRPLAATNPRVRELFLLGRARPREDWLEQTPLFDAWAPVMMYSPQRPLVIYDVPEPAPPPLAMRTFLEFLRLLPAPERIFSSDSAVVASLFHWADADPVRWTQVPVKFDLCAAMWARQRYSEHCPSPITPATRRDSLQPPRAPAAP